MVDFDNCGGLSSACYCGSCKECKYTKCTHKCHPDGTRGWKMMSNKQEGDSVVHE